MLFFVHLVICIYSSLIVSPLVFFKLCLFFLWSISCFAQFSKTHKYASMLEKKFMCCFDHPTISKKISRRMVRTRKNPKINAAVQPVFASLPSNWHLQSKMKPWCQIHSVGMLFAWISLGYVLQY